MKSSEHDDSASIVGTSGAAQRSRGVSLGNQGPLVIVGDALLDVDIEGRADRLCPEAPVPVVDVGGEWQRPGGAGLAALLAARSLPDVVLITALGTDEAGRRLARLLDGEVDVLPIEQCGHTPHKTRIRAAGQSLVRMDTGDGKASTADPGPHIARALREAAAVLVSDYGRGVTANPVVGRLLAEAAGRVPLVWDPHPRGAAPVPGARLVTPNQQEAAGFAGGSAEPAELAATMLRHWDSGGVAVTVGDKGAVLAEAGDIRGRTIPIPTKSRVAAGTRNDTCGAGDRFASAAAAALHRGADIGEAVASAVEAAARFVAAGAAPALSSRVPEQAEGDRPEMSRAFPSDAATAFQIAERTRRSGGRLVATGGCFDLLHPGHISLLRQARALGDALVVCLNSDESVRMLKGPGRPIVPAAGRADLLTALEAVDAVVVFDESSPTEVLQQLAPDVWVKGGDYQAAELPEADVVHRHGGEIAFVPMVDGYSTTRLVTADATGKE